MGKGRLIDKETVEQRVWDWLIAQPNPAGRSAIAAAVGLKPTTAWAALSRMGKKNMARMIGISGSPKAKWEAIGKRPIDSRGGVRHPLNPSFLDPHTFGGDPVQIRRKLAGEVAPKIPTLGDLVASLTEAA